MADKQSQKRVEYEVHTKTGWCPCTASEFKRWLAQGLPVRMEENTLTVYNLPVKE